MVSTVNDFASNIAPFKLQFVLQMSITLLISIVNIIYKDIQIIENSTKHLSLKLEVILSNVPRLCDMYR